MKSSQEIEDFIDVERLDIEEYTPQVKHLVEKLINLVII